MNKITTNRIGLPREKGGALAGALANGTKLTNGWLRSNGKGSFRGTPLKKNHPWQSASSVLKQKTANSSSITSVEREGG